MTEDGGSKPWHWPREWARQESFWRDVATRTVAGLLVVLIGYLCALALGYFALPDAVPSLALGLIAAWGWYSLVRLIRKKPVDRKIDQWLWLAVTILLVPLTIWVFYFYR